MGGLIAFVVVLVLLVMILLSCIKIVPQAITLRFHLFLHGILNRRRRDDVLKLHTVHLDSPGIRGDIQRCAHLRVERLGAYQQTWSVGLHIKVPFIDKVAKRVVLKEQVVDFAPQPVITKDNVTMRIDTVVFFQITDPRLLKRLQALDLQHCLVRTCLTDHADTVRGSLLYSWPSRI